MNKIQLIYRFCSVLSKHCWQNPKVLWILANQCADMISDSHTHTPTFIRPFNISQIKQRGMQKTRSKERRNEIRPIHIREFCMHGVQLLSMDFLQDCVRSVRCNAFREKNLLLTFIDFPSVASETTKATYRQKKIVIQYMCISGQLPWYHIERPQHLTTMCRSQWYIAIAYATCKSATRLRQHNFAWAVRFPLARFTSHSNMSPYNHRNRHATKTRISIRRKQKWFLLWMK